jgi:hypothetical protein
VAERAARNAERFERHIRIGSSSAWRVSVGV